MHPIIKKSVLFGVLGIHLIRCSERPGFVQRLQYIHLHNPFAHPESPSAHESQSVALEQVVHTTCNASSQEQVLLRVTDIMKDKQTLDEKSAIVAAYLDPVIASVREKTERQHEAEELRLRAHQQAELRRARWCYNTSVVSAGVVAGITGIGSVALVIFDFYRLCP